MDWSPVTLEGWVGVETKSVEPSTKKIEPAVSVAVLMQFAGLHQICAGNSIGMTVLIRPFDFIIALIAPVAPCE